MAAEMDAKRLMVAFRDRDDITNGVAAIALLAGDKPGAARPGKRLATRQP